MKFKSKSLISIILSIMMVISMILVAIPANAAVVDSVPVGAASGGKMLTGDILYVDITNIEGYSNISVNVIRTDGEKQTQYLSSSEIPSDGIIKLTLTADMDFTRYTNVQLFKCSKNWNTAVYYSTAPANGQNMIIISSTYDSYTWGTYGGSSTTQYAVNFGKGGTGSGTVTAKAGSTTLASGSKVNNNTSVTFTAEADANNTFDGWYSTQDCSGTAVSTDNPYTKTVTAITNVYAKFTSTATPTTQYYIGGRFKVNDSGGTEHLTYDPTGNNNVWNASCTDINFKFIEDSSNSGWYYLNTNLTVAELSAQLSGKDSNGNAQSWYPYFLIHTGSGDSGTWYGAISDRAMHSLQNTNALPSAPNLTSRTSQNEEKQLIKFSDTQSTIAGNVTLHFNPTELKLYYTTDSTSTPGDFNIIDKTAANGKLTFSAPDKAAGTASADDEVTVTATPDKYFECTTIVVTYKDSKKVSHNIDATKTAANTFTFTVPSGLTTADIKDQEITVKGTFTLTSSGKLDYVKAKGSGLYIDVAPKQNDTTATLIKWNNYYGKDHNTTENPYTFYVPKNVNLSNAHIYNGFNNEVKLNGVSIPAYSMETVSLAAGQTYNYGNDNSYTVKVMQGSTDAMFLHTTNKDGTDFDLPTKRKWTTDYNITDKDAADYKAEIKSSGGSCTTMDNTSNTANFSSAMGLDTVKGRGNSSWKASATMFGKYAFNMKLKSKTNLLGMDSTESEGAKSWCLLANNADESMLRNALTYQLASEIGLLYSPEFRFVDIYDNGEYMGSYLVTEKVDVGSSKLVKGKSFEDLNEDAVKAQGGTEINETLSNNATYSFTDSQGNNHSNLSMRYATVGTNTGSSPFEYNTTGKYLLEFEISERVNDEPCYFVSPHGQNVVVKNPEYATKEQVEYIAQKFAAMEDMAFTTGATKAQLSTVMDVESFAKMYLIQEFSSNLDAASTSYYLTFDCSQANPVFVANPVWDYDWAYGQYTNTSDRGAKKPVSGNDQDAYLQTSDPEKWVAKYKSMDDSKGGSAYSIQSQLASQNSDFKSVVRKVWEETNGFYDKIQTYYGTDGQIMTWYNQIKDSVNMNETRWGFIASNPISTWGSTNTGNTHLDAVNYLETTWTAARATWLNAQFANVDEYAPFTPATPASTVTDLDGTAKTSFEVGESFLINVTTVEDGVTYSVYHGDTNVGDNVENGKIKVVATADMIGGQTFTVKATYGETVVTSNVEVTVNASSDVMNITVYFKTATAPAYAPSVSFDGGNVTAITTKTQELGKDYSGSLTFAWYSVEIQNVDTTKTHTLTFTSKRTKLNATWNGTLTKDSYFTADNLMNGTVAVNLTDKSVAERNFFYSATNMVYDSTDAKNKTLGFTYYGGARVKMGSVVNDSNGTVTAVSAPTVKSATYIQMLNASMITVSSLQSELYDVNFDGKVDVKDATYIQYALAS